MESKHFLGCVIVVFALTLGSSEAHRFNVGDRDGWVVDPRESFNHWAERNRFQINDTLVFKYRRGSDSVLVVTEDNYNYCNLTHPLQAYTDGNSVFKLTRSGPFYFISGNAEHCGRGQKLIVVVLSPRHRAATPPPPPVSPIPSTSTPPSAEPAPAPSPVAVSPIDQPAASPSSRGESLSPAPAPESSSASGFGSSVGGTVSLLVLSSIFGLALV